MPDFPVSEQFVRSANAAQLHAEARGSLVKWPASFCFDDGEWLYRVERDDVDEDAVEAAIAAHVPNPEYGLPPDVLTLRGLAAKASLTAQEVAQAVRLILRKSV